MDLLGFLFLMKEEQEGRSWRQISGFKRPNDSVLFLKNEISGSSKLGKNVDFSESSISCKNAHYWGNPIQFMCSSELKLGFTGHRVALRRGESLENSW